jgi:hypothetical protein
MSTDTITCGTLRPAVADWRGQLVTRTRANGETFIGWRDPANHDDWTHVATREAHGDRLPDDHVYAMVALALDALQDSDEDVDPDDALDAVEAPVYTSELTQWLASSNLRYGYVDEAAAEYGRADSVLGELAAGWLAEFREIAQSVLASLIARTEEVGADA